MSFRGDAVKGGLLSRRELLQWTTRIAAGLPFAGSAVPRLYGGVLQQNQNQKPPSVTPPPLNGGAPLFEEDPTKYRFTAEEDKFLEEFERACFQFFWDEVNPYTGLAKDRSQAGGPDSRNVGSIAATGFGLSGLCIAEHRGWEDKKHIRDRV